MTAADHEWQKVKFPEELLNALRGLDVSEEIPGPNEGLDDDFKLIQDFVRQNWQIHSPRRFAEFAQSLHSILIGNEITEMKRTIAPFYAKTGEPMEILVCVYEKIQIWLSSGGFAVEIEGEREFYPIVKGKVKESMKSFVEALANNPEVICGVIFDRQRLLRFILEKNTAALHSKRCFSVFMDNFIDTAKGICLTHSVLLAPVQKLRGEYDSDDNFGICIFDHAGIQIYWAYNRIVIIKNEENGRNVEEFPIENARKVAEMKEKLQPLASLLFSRLPIDRQAIVSLIFAPHAQTRS